MDFLDPAKKRKNRIKLMLGYILVAIAIGLAAVVIIVWAYGYTIDRKTGTVIQNGIVFVSSRPSDAEIYLNGQKYSSNTDARIVLPSAQYKLEIKKDGYRLWQRDFFLAGGQIERVVYPMLFPETLKTDDVETFASTPTLITQSPDRRWLLTQKSPKSTEFQVYDLNSELPLPNFVNLPDNVLSDGTTSFEVVEWSNDNRRLILKHNFQKKTEYIVVDRERPQESMNINKLTETTPENVSLRDKKYDQWYIHDDLKLLFATESNPEPQTLVEDVIEYKSHGNDVILYATNRQATKGMTRIMLWENNESRVLREVVYGDKYLLEIARFDDRWYMVAGSVKDGKVYVYENPMDQLKSEQKQELVPVTIMRLRNPHSVSFAQNARFVVLQAGSEFTVYDAEAKRSFRYDTGLKFTKNQKATWMDGHRLSAVIEGEVTVFDFDGINVQKLGQSSAKAAPFFSADYEQLYTIVPKGNSNEASLTRAQLVVK